LEGGIAGHATPVEKDRFLLLTETSSLTIPNILLPSQLHNDGNYILSLSQLCRYLATKAEELGVDIYPGFAAASVVMKRVLYRALSRLQTLDKYRCQNPEG
jgi:flavin-dependent dehydrogenase